MENHNENQTIPRPARHARHRKDGLSRIFTGLIVIWLGITLYMENQDWLDYSWWAYFILGIGILLIVEACIRMYQNNGYSGQGKLIGGSVLIAVGGSHIYNIDNWWPLIFIAVGLMIIVMNLRREKNPEEVSEK
jgi:hypothetical protein